MNDINLRGPWDKKLTEYVKTLNIVMVVYNLKDNTIEFEFPLDYGNSEHRKFIGKVSFWAITHGMSTEIMSKQEWEKNGGY